MIESHPMDPDGNSSGHSKSKDLTPSLPFTAEITVVSLTSFTQRIGSVFLLNCAMHRSAVELAFVA
jgi:hypothetical protein